MSIKKKRGAEERDTYGRGRMDQKTE